MRQGINDMFHEQMKRVDQITLNIKQFPTENERMKFENTLSKKVQNVEYLGKILIKQEKEFLSVLKTQSKLFKKMNITKNDMQAKEGKYELQSLLNESSSDDDGLNEDEVSDEEAKPTPGDFIDDWVDPEED